MATDDPWVTFFGDPDDDDYPWDTKIAYAAPGYAGVQAAATKELQDKQYAPGPKGAAARAIGLPHAR